MSRNNTILALAAGMGCIAGMRSMSAPALLSRHISGGPPADGSEVVRLLAQRRAAGALTFFAAGEMLADKMPFMRSRTEPVSLAGRMLSGAITGGAIAEYAGGSRSGAALLGGVAAVCSTFLVYRLRKAGSQATGLPDLLLGLAEDAVVLVWGRRLASAVTRENDRG